MEAKTRNVVKLVLVAVVVSILAVTAFYFFYGRPVERMQNKVIEEKTRENEQLKLLYGREQLKVDSLTASTKAQKKELEKLDEIIKQIPKKYEKDRIRVINLSSDDKLRYVADWLSEEDSLGR